MSGNNSFLRRPKLNPSPEIEKRILDEIAKAMAITGARLRKNPNDTGALYAEGISYGLRSNYFWVVKKAWRESLRDATSARKLHNRISELEPNNVDARLVQVCTITSGTCPGLQDAGSWWASAATRKELHRPGRSQERPVEPRRCGFRCAPLANQPCLRWCRT